LLTHLRADEYETLDDDPKPQNRMYAAGIVLRRSKVMNGQREAVAHGSVGASICGKYRLERLVGSGGMASVYEAVHRNGHRVAIKMLHRQLSMDGDLRARFLREGYVANKVNHRGAVRVLDDDVAQDGSVFLVMELLEGETLEARCRRSANRLPVQEVCEHALQLLEVLAAAHDKGVVHRDIKPDNLFFTNEGVLKVLDFGIARLDEPAGGEAAKTRTGRTMGTPAFMPPEQALGKARHIGPQADLWAAGATMFTLLSGEYVHPAETMQEMLVLSATQHPRSIASVSPEVPPVLAAVIDRALAYERDVRWPDARSMRAALVEAVRQSYGGPAASTASVRPGEAFGYAAPAAAMTPPPAGRTLPVPGLSTEPVLQPSRRPGVSTTGGIGRTAPGRPSFDTAAAPRPTRRALWVGLASVLLLAGGAAVVRLRGLPSLGAFAGWGTRGQPSASETAPPPEPAPAVPAPQMPAASAPAAQASAATPTPTTTTTTLPPPNAAAPRPPALLRRPQSAQRAPAVATAPPNAPPAVVASAPENAPPPASLAPPSTVPAASAKCRLVSYLDPDGTKRFRQECP
jgi:serine/threonine-protein kinase